MADKVLLKKKLLLLIILRRRRRREKTEERKKKKKKRFWVRDIFKKRMELGDSSLNNSSSTNKREAFLHLLSSHF